MTTPTDTEHSPRNSDENLTVVVFRQNDASRSFKVSQRWIRQLGWLAGTMVLLTLVSVILALRFYREARLADPSRVQDLERSLSDLKQSYKNLEAKAALPSTASSPVAQQAALPTAAPAAHATPEAPPAPIPAMAIEPAGMPITFFPSGIQAVSAPDSRPIRISQPSVTASGRTIRAKFAFQYVANDQGSQQGRFMLIARGPDSIQVYPEGTLGTGNAGSLIQPDQGEYFSVSRYREVNAEFTSGPRGALPTTLEIFVFTTDGKLYMHQTLPVTAASANKASAKPAKAAPANAAAKGAATVPAGAPAQTEAAPNSADKTLPNEGAAQ